MSTAYEAAHSVIYRCNRNTWWFSKWCYLRSVGSNVILRLDLNYTSTWVLFNYMSYLKTFFCVCVPWKHHLSDWILCCKHDVNSIIIHCKTCSGMFSDTSQIHVLRCQGLLAMFHAVSSSDTLREKTSGRESCWTDYMDPRDLCLCSQMHTIASHSVPIVFSSYLHIMFF
jgi:hypothetical protein